MKTHIFFLLSIVCFNTSFAFTTDEKTVKAILGFSFCIASATFYARESYEGFANYKNPARWRASNLPNCEAQFAELRFDGEKRNKMIKKEKIRGFGCAVLAGCFGTFGYFSLKGLL